MGELTGGLIEMNAKMVITDGAAKLFSFGLIFVVAFAILLIMFARDRNAGGALISVVFVVAGIVLMIAAVRQPRVRELRVCANGPVSIEQIATKYDIVSVNGKELVLRER